MNRPFYFMFFCLVTLLCISCKSGQNNEQTDGSSTLFPELKQQIREFPDSLELVDALIDSLDRSGNIEEAAIWADTLYLRDTLNNLMYLVVKGDLLRDAGNYDDAARAFEHYLFHRPGDEAVEMAHANVLAEAGNPNAISIADALGKRYTSRDARAALYFVKGVYFNSIKDHTTARSYLDSAISIDYTFANAYYEKGLGWYDESNFKEAIQTFSKMVEISSKDADGWYWLGKSQEAAGNKAEAINAYQRSLMIEPNEDAVAAIERLRD